MYYIEKQQCCLAVISPLLYYLNLLCKCKLYINNMRVRVRTMGITHTVK